MSAERDALYIKKAQRRFKYWQFLLRTGGISWPKTGDEPEMEAPVSQVVTQSQIESSAFKKWCSEMKAEPRFLCRLWEQCYVLQVLYLNGMLEQGHTGLGFGVGNEALPAVMAKYGCRILATDLQTVSLEQVNVNKICDPDRLLELVSCRRVDMNSIDVSLTKGEFDFIWSCSSLEHLWSIQLGLEFIKESLRCLKPGGIAVHTTEYNLSSNEDTVDNSDTVFFRKRDLESLIYELEGAGHNVDRLNVYPGSGEIDKEINIRPWIEGPLKRLKRRKYVITPIGLIIRSREDGQ